MFENFMETGLWLIPGAPLLAAALLALFGKAFFGERSHQVCIAGITVSLLLSLIVLFSGMKGGHASVSHGDENVEAVSQSHTTLGVGDNGLSAIYKSNGYEWLHVGDLRIGVDIRADAMTAIMLTTVTLVSLLVAIFAGGYMHGDPGYPRFFAAFSLFVFSMCMLVLANNFLLLFVFWEAVGLCSYLLIGFWFTRPSAAAAAKKAFVVNRIGDFGFLLGIFLIWTTFGTLDYEGVLGRPDLIARIAATSPELIYGITILLFIGAMGKSAQFPLHVWLPDAMEGPTPVSALIHAATMVTAGVYMVARCTPLYIHSPEVQVTIATIGGITALVAALIALTQFDLKRVLAYSTVSQLGFMFLALGSAAAGAEFATFAVTAAMFHLFTHAFFKAVLFLSAGSVMHSMGDVIDMRRFGGLKRVMPTTHGCFLAGALALAGFPLLSGFWSKDDIIAALSQATHHETYGTLFFVLWCIALITALLTAFYTFRAYFLTFHGPERFPPEAGHHPHEAPPAMAQPLRVLAFFSLTIGLIVGPTTLFAHYLEKTPGLPAAGEHHLHWDVMLISTVVALGGIGLAYAAYVGSRVQITAWANRMGSMYRWSQERFYLDEIFFALLVLPLRGLAQLCLLFDRYVIDRLLDFIGAVPRWFGRGLQPLQNGLVPSYLLVMFGGLIVMVLLMMQAWAG
ncbi:MAG: NADH-quinone oxidoreductase subunit L [Planctomycetota bacterium]|nr:NADH-quinone oxidoreductase subunit L [Planctomycetota bacterium]MDA1210884.1 NADH-quinone oxidoreductase subunit L [Planctomycetota bacterium]